jgi:hypothetical protein
MAPPGSNAEAAVVLGRQIAAEMDHRDTLSVWMAQRIGELIERYERSDGADRDQVGAMCTSEILDLWSNRGGFPRSPRPMESFDSLYRALDRLDPASDQTFYGLPRFSEGRPDGDPSGVILDIALQIEERVRHVVQLLVAEVADIAVTKEANWIAAADAFVGDAESNFRHSRLFESLLATESDQPASSRMRALKKYSGDLIALLTLVTRIDEGERETEQPEDD